MFIGRKKELGTITNLLKGKRESPDKSLIIGVSGLFGSGKTTLLNEVVNNIISEGNSDGIYVTNEDITISTLPEFVYSLASTFKPLGKAKPRFNLDETDSRRRRYLQIIGKLGIDVIPVLRELRNNNLALQNSEDYKVLENEKLALEIAIKNQFNSSDDQKLILDTSKVVTESFIIDMMTTHFPLLEKMQSLQDYISNNEAPRKIIFFIDTFEKISPLVNPWLLESLLPYFYTKRFGDLQIYKSSYLPEDAFIRDFFDVRFVIAGREKLTMTDVERRWDRFRTGITEVRIEPFNEDELKNYLSDIGLNSKQEIENVMNLTHGLPYLASLWIDSNKNNLIGDDKALMNSLAEQRIFWYKTPEQCNWIRCASFLEWFDSDALQCFPCIPNEMVATEAYDYLRYSSEIVQPSQKKEGKFEVYEIIRTSLRDSTWQESTEMAIEFQEAAQSFYDSFSFLEKYQNHEKHLIRRLAYFHNFDDEAIARCFGGEAHIVRELISNSTDLIENKNSIFSMNEDIANKLRRYNRCVDKTNYLKILDEVRELWFWRRNYLEKEINEREVSSQEIKKQIIKTNADLEMNNTLRNEAERSMSDLKVEFRNLKRDNSGSMTSKENLIFRTSLFFLAIFILLLLTVKSFPIEVKTQDILRSASFILAPFFLFVCAGIIGKIVFSKNKSNDRKDIREDVVSIENRLLNKQYEYHDLGSQIKKYEFEISALNANLERLKLEVSGFELKLINSYV